MTWYFAYGSNMDSYEIADLLVHEEATPRVADVIRRV
ncbi:hypothetical protein Rhom172_0372 [Rhodothermus marinus SG0.5JP17-172]|nr:hypothetical protein Rhom172_0372 [Rhodothermus marinus SG0.5JP17-172]